jgi:hypothetical protein
VVVAGACGDVFLPLPMQAQFRARDVYCSSGSNTLWALGISHDVDASVKSRGSVLGGAEIIASGILFWNASVMSANACV